MSTLGESLNQLIATLPQLLMMGMVVKLISNELMHALNASNPNQVQLPPRGTGLLLGTAGERRAGQPRTEEERLERHGQIFGEGERGQEKEDQAERIIRGVVREIIAYHKSPIEGLIEAGKQVIPEEKRDEFEEAARELKDALDVVKDKITKIALIIAASKSIKA